MSDFLTPGVRDFKRVIEGFNAARERDLELKGPYARVWWHLACFGPCTYQAIAREYCRQVPYYSKDGTPNRLSAYIQRPDRFYADSCHPADREKCTGWHGAQLSGVLHRMLKQGYVKQCLFVYNKGEYLPVAGPRGGRVYMVDATCKIPKEVLA